ncbi:sigma-70 family RNA polymerase sigma factor [Actinophytocola sp.]|uniref:sigma-70 family RNA polymerase sigma factor n=1 Tax=Actinophytocola sp. TaxID=1872138 RepID=UPI002D6B7C8B|nr:sigma-70 family RNA polymerase sigma factor [Actinophytocola sp.]HYQ64972.1 sigma-70 family RNA polymerase sigma factor [Actinophytocola sp.]
MSEHSDAELVAGVLAGDRDAFAAVYDRYADRLHDFCHSVLRDRDEAADAVQDTFVLAAQRLVQLNDPDRLRPWLYAVARSVALRRVRARRRVVLDEVGEMADTDPGPHRAAEQEALRELVWTAAGGLSERDRALLDLHLRQGLEGAELGEAMGVSTSHAYVLLTRLRDQVERSLGALLIARLGRADCTELDAVLSGWDGKFSPIMRKRVARHVDQCDVCADRRRIAVSPWALLAGVPLLPAPLFLRDRVMAQVQLASMDVPTEQNPTTEHGESGEGQGGTGQGAGRTGAGAGTAAGAGLAVEAALAAEESDERAVGGPFSSRRAKVTAAAAAVLALLVAGMAVVYWRGDTVEGKPLALENSVALPTTTDTTRTATTTPTATTVPTTTTGPTTTTRKTTTRRTTTTTRPVTTTTNVVQPPPPPPPPPPSGDTTPPVVTSASAEPTTIYATYCQQSPASSSVQATASDDVGVTSVTLTWSGKAGSGSAAMSRDGDTWYSGMGDFANPGDVSWRVIATDAAGNTSEPRSGRITVRDCPVG